MSVVVGQDTVGPCRKQLTVEVPLPAVEAETLRIVRELQRKARVPGFRKGRLPKDLVMSRFRKEIESEVKDRLVPRYWRQAEAEAGLRPLLAPELQSVDFKLGEGMRFVAAVEIRPDVELRDYRDFELPDPQVEPTAEEVESALDDLRRRAGTWKVVARPAARGDRVRARISASDEAGEGEEAVVEVGAEGVWEELTLAVTGASAGQETVFERRTESGSRRYQALVQEVLELELPPLDDGFAAAVGDFSSVEEVRRNVYDALRRAKRQRRRQERERAMLRQLCDRHPLELPEGVLRRETEELLKEYAGQLEQRGVDVERTAVDWNRLALELQPQAEHRVHARLLLDAIAAAEEVEVPEEQLERILTDLARAQKRSPLAVRRELDESGRLASLRAELQRQEVIRLLLPEEGDE